MKNTLTIYTSFAQKKFLASILENFQLDFKKLEDANYSNTESDKVLFFVPQDSNKSLIKKYLKLKNILLILPKNIIGINKSKRNSILTYPTTIDKFKETISQMFFFWKRNF